MLDEKEVFALEVLNKVIDRIEIPTRDKISLCNEFTKEIRRRK